MQRDAIAWTKRMWDRTKGGEGREALAIYHRMREEGLIPTHYTFVAALKACSSIADLDSGKVIHAHAIASGHMNIFVANGLLDMYSKCGSIAEAVHVFEKMRPRDGVSWNTMIFGYAHVGMGDLALHLFARMQKEGLTPNSRTFVAALKACAAMAAQQGGRGPKEDWLEQGRAIHAQATRLGLQNDVFLTNTLLDMYAKCGSMEAARQVFEDMGTRRNIVSWNAIITGYAHMEMEALALELYARLRDEGLRPSSLTFVAVLHACTSLAVQSETSGLVKADYLKQGRTIHAEIAGMGLESDTFVASTLVDMYAKCRSISDARLVFERMTHRSIVSWNTIINGYAQMGMGASALQLYERMQKEGFAPNAHTFVAALKACSCLVAEQQGRGAQDELIKTACLDQGRAIHFQVAKGGLESNIFVASALVNMYVTCGSTEHARQIFEKMGHHDVISWTAMITGYAQMDEGDVALELYNCMQYEGFMPNCHTFAAVLQACGSLALLESGKQVHSQIYRAGLQGQTFVASCLIDMYGKCGSMWDAQQYFDSLLVRNHVIWNALIAGYSGQGDAEQVFDSYRRMQEEGITPDGSTFVSVLNTCCHSGLLDKGCMYFRAMSLENSIFPSRKHYSCMIDLLGRAGQLDEATAMVMKMPHKSDMVIWTAVFAACQKWNNVEMGRHVFECGVMLDENFAECM